MGQHVDLQFLLALGPCYATEVFLFLVQGHIQEFKLFAVVFFEIVNGFLGLGAEEYLNVLVKAGLAHFVEDGLQAFDGLSQGDVLEGDSPVVGLDVDFLEGLQRIQLL